MVTANILHYASSTRKRVCKQVLAAELFTLIAGCDTGYMIAPMLSEIIGRNI